MTPPSTYMRGSRSIERFIYANVKSTSIIFIFNLKLFQPPCCLVLLSTRFVDVLGGLADLRIPPLCVSLMGLLGRCLWVFGRRTNINLASSTGWSVLLFRPITLLRI